MSEPLAPYLKPLSLETPAAREQVRAFAQSLVRQASGARARIEVCFRFVRDAVTHTVDAGGGPVTCSPLSVLHARTGFCFAKAHLLAALLRSLGIPSALVYQRLRSEDTDPASPLCLHGLVAVFLEPYGWVRLDPRGDLPPVTTAFTPPAEQLAYRVRNPGECDLPGLYREPLPQVQAILQGAIDYQGVLAALPDWRAPCETTCIRWAQSAELVELAAIEMAAGERFREHGLPDVADAPGLPLGALAAGKARAQLFVAEVDQQRAGFCLVECVDGEGHLTELSVLPQYGRRGVGSELLAYALSWADANGFPSMTLSTFRDVPFNAPFYLRRGFRPIAPGAEGPELSAKRAQERARGLSTNRRVTLRKQLDAQRSDRPR